MADMGIRGTEDLAKLAKDLHSAADDVRKKLSQRIDEAAKPASNAVQDAYGRAMPQRGGFAASVQRMPVKVDRKTSGPEIGISVQLPEGLENGALRHPVFGNGSVIVEQKVPSGIGAAALQAQMPEVERKVLAAVDDITNEIARG